MGGSVHLVIELFGVCQLQLILHVGIMLDTHKKKNFFFFGICLYFIKIHSLNTYDTLYTRHEQLLDLTFSVSSTESKYVNYLVRAKSFFRDSAFPAQGQTTLRAIDAGSSPKLSNLPASHFTNLAFIAWLHIALLLRHNLT